MFPFISCSQSVSHHTPWFQQHCKVLSLSHILAFIASMTTIFFIQFQNFPHILLTLPEAAPFILSVSYDWCSCSTMKHGSVINQSLSLSLLSLLDPQIFTNTHLLCQTSLYPTSLKFSTLFSPHTSTAHFSSTLLPPPLPISSHSLLTHCFHSVSPHLTHTFLLESLDIHGFTLAMNN